MRPGRQEYLPRQYALADAGEAALPTCSTRVVDLSNQPVCPAIKSVRAWRVGACLYHRSDGFGRFLVPLRYRRSEPHKARADSLRKGIIR